MNALALSAVAVPGLLLAFFAARKSSASPLPSTLVLDSIDANVIGELVNSQEWQKVAARPENAAYVLALRGAELRHKIPNNMLVRLAWQESRFRPDVISGQVVSPAGAVGIMQIIPRWHPTVDALNPIAAINYAGGYLKKLYRQFGSWQMALAAYNWGEGNLRDKGLAAAPLETREYYTAILHDVRVSGTVIV